MSGDPNFDVCVYCNATGCEDGTAVHADDCPSETGIFPVREEDVYERVVCDNCGHRNHLGMRCGRCSEELKVGDFYHHLRIESFGDDGIPVYEIVCAGCAAHAALKETA